MAFAQVRYKDFSSKIFSEWNKIPRIFCLLYFSFSAWFFPFILKFSNVTLLLLLHTFTVLPSITLWVWQSRNLTHSHTTRHTWHFSRLYFPIHYSIFIFFMIINFLMACHSSSNSDWLDRDNKSQINPSVLCPPFWAFLLEFPFLIPG